MVVRVRESGTIFKTHFSFIKFLTLNKVNRCLARYSPRATTTNQPTNRAPNEQARPGSKWPKMSILGQIWSFSGKKSKFLLEKQKFWYPHNGNTTWAPCVHCFFGLAWYEMGQKCIYPTKYGHFRAKKPNSYVRKQKFWYLRIKTNLAPFFCIVYWSGMGSKGPKIPTFG